MHVLATETYFDLIDNTNKEGGKKNCRKIMMMQDTFAIFRFFNQVTNRMLYNAEQVYFKDFMDAKRKFRKDNKRKLN